MAHVISEVVWQRQDEQYLSAGRQGCEPAGVHSAVAARAVKASRTCKLFEPGRSDNVVISCVEVMYLCKATMLVHCLCSACSHVIMPSSAGRGCMQQTGAIQAPCLQMVIVLCKGRLAACSQVVDHASLA